MLGRDGPTPVPVLAGRWVAVPVAAAVVDVAEDLAGLVVVVGVAGVAGGAVDVVVPKPEGGVGGPAGTPWPAWVGCPVRTPTAPTTAAMARVATSTMGTSTARRPFPGRAASPDSHRSHCLAACIHSRAIRPLISLTAPPAGGPGPSPNAGVDPSFRRPGGGGGRAVPTNANPRTEAGGVGADAVRLQVGSDVAARLTRGRRPRHTGT